MPESIFASFGFDPLIGRDTLIPKPIPSDGNGRWKVITPPSTEPITLTELKEFARIDTSDEDALLTSFIKAARENTERYLNRSLLFQTLVLSMDIWPGNKIELPMPPLLDVFEIRTLDEDDVVTVYSTDNYQFRANIEPGQVFIRRGYAAPTNTEREFGGFEIEFVAGYGDLVTDVPESIRIGIMHWATYIYENRTIGKEPPPEAKAWLDSFRIINI